MLPINGQLNLKRPVLVHETNIKFEPPANAVLRWLTTSGPRVPAHVAVTLLGALYNSPKAAIVASLAIAIQNTFAFIQSGDRIFAVLLGSDIVLAAVRFRVARKVERCAARKTPIPTDLYLWTTLVWCGLQGTSIFMAVFTGIPALQILAGAMAAGLMGPVCARNYAAPSWAWVLSALVYLPFVAGALILGESWSLIVVLQAPLYFFACSIIVAKLTDLAVSAHLAQAESHHNAVHDNLTRLVNRAGLREALLQPSWRACSHFCVFYLDLDGFKAINDKFGHLAGDRVLQRAAARLVAATTPADIVARMGGDEFVVVAPGMTPEAAAAFAASLIARVIDPAAGREDDTPLFRFGVSAGYACAPYDGTGIEELIRKADTALIETKRSAKGTSRRFADAGVKTSLALSPLSSAA